jgi:hypothetical protein
VHGPAPADFLLGAVIVFPIWFVVRLFRKSNPKP